MERKLISDLSIDPDELAEETELFSGLLDVRGETQSRHHISKVVVLHENKLQTFSDELLSSSDDVQFDMDSFWSGNLAWF